MAGGDVSGCLEMTAAYCNFMKFDSGRFAIVWDCTGDADEVIFGKDPTVDVTGSAFYLDYLKLGCTSTPVRLYDGSGGALIASLVVSDVSPSANMAETWDFRGDPLKCLVAENTESLCISAADGHTWGFIKGGWGKA
jgi:hypothetical protein